MKRFLQFKLFIVFLTIALISFGFMEGDKNGKGLNKDNKIYKTTTAGTPGKNGDAVRFDINNLDIPMNNFGTIADVNLNGRKGGEFGGKLKVFLFSGGFMMTGYTNGKLWGCAQATASLIENFIPGPVGKNNDPNAVMYVLRKDEEPFGKGWQDWKDAVALGADFYDGDGDGVYNPIDKNANGLWDKDEDCPDILGDQTTWCVFNDGKLASQRLRFPGVDPQGIEVKQTVFAFESKGSLGNILFVRYRITNRGTKADTLKNVLFGVWADPDLGDPTNDLVGVDTLRNAGFVYQDRPDAVYGSNPPCFMIDYFSGPISYLPGVTFTDVDGNGKYDENVDIALDTAYSNRGLLKGVKKYPGAKNLGVSTFVHYQQSDPVLGDPDDEIQARNYMEGKNKVGEVLNPCTFNLGSVKGGVNCANVNPKFWYSGDPVTQKGWINIRNTDQRQMTNVGPIDLVKDQEAEITVAYVVGQGTDAISSITEARRIDDGAQFIFDMNFAAPSAPPAVKPLVETGEDWIDLTWDTKVQVSFKDSTAAWNDKFEGFNVYAFRTNSTVPTVNGITNSMLYTSYDVQDTIKDVYKEDLKSGGKFLLYPQSSNPLDAKIYSDSATGRIRLRITKDPFTGGNLVKGKPYYFAITSYALNQYGLKRKNISETPGTLGDVYLSGSAFVGEIENIPTIINHNSSAGIIMGENIYNPPVAIVNSNHLAGASTGFVGYDIINKNQFKPGTFTVSFFKNPATPLYSNYWSLTEDKTGLVLLDSQKVMDYDNPSVAEKVVNGFLVRVQDVTATVDSPYVYSGTKWYKTPNYTRGTGVFYVGKDLPQTKDVPEFTVQTPILSKAITADKLRKVELRFGGTGNKAYRYLQGYSGPLPVRYAGAITAADTVGKGAVGKLGEGFVDVPFSAWVKDSLYKEEYQLAVGFVERRITSQYSKANPDGIWNPSDTLLKSGEVIIIFDTPYDPTGNQKQYTGGTFTKSNGTTVTAWADVLKRVGGTIPDTGIVGMTPEMTNTFNSPWFNAMYVVGLEKLTPTSNYNDGDKLTISLKSYPYTNNDKYRIDAGAVLTDEQKKGIFDRVNVFPNPLFGYNAGTSYSNGNPDEPFVTFSNLPEEITIKIYSLSGNLLRILTTADKSAPSSPFLRWNLQNDSGLRVASGMYLAIVSSPKYGEKILKFALVMPQKQIQKY